jgi:hypothetical protein
VDYPFKDILVYINVDMGVTYLGHFLDPEGPYLQFLTLFQIVEIAVLQFVLYCYKLTGNGLSLFITNCGSMTDDVILQLNVSLFAASLLYCMGVGILGFLV